MIVNVPIEYFPAFYEQPERATIELLSIPSGSVNPFFRNTDKIQLSIKKGKHLKNPLDEYTYQFSPDFVSNDEEPRYMHIDLAINGDSVGIAMCHATKYETRSVRMAGETEAKDVQLPIIEFDFVGRLSPRIEYGEHSMSYAAIEEMVAEIATNRGFNLFEGLITFDRFQSHQLSQTIQGMGIPCGLLSIDHTVSKVIVDFSKDGFIRKVGTPREPAAAMVALRDAIYREGVTFPQIPMYDDYRSWLEKEIDECQWDGEKGKAVKMDGGSDDMLQAIAGAVFNCINNAKPTGNIPTMDQDSQNAETAFYDNVGMSNNIETNDEGFVEDGFDGYARSVDYMYNRNDRSAL